MLIVSHTVQTKASPAAIWKIWKDVENWNTWDHSLESSTLNGPFQVGSTGTIKCKGDPLLPMRLTRIEPDKRFDCEVKLFCARVTSEHTIEVKHGITHVTNTIEAKGPLAFFFAFVIGRAIKKKLPTEMAEMIKKAESM